MPPEARRCLGHPSRVVHDLDWDGCFAARDLGGLATQRGVTASGVYVRSDNARNLSSLGWKQAWEYGIRTVLDLRSEAERVGDPPAPSQFERRRISLFAHFDDDPTYRADFLARLSECDTATKYRSLYSEALDLDCRRFAEALDVLATSPRGVLFHCVGGKDRTGVLAGLLLRLVGVSMDDVEADYIHTEARARGRAESPPIDQSAPAGVITQVIEELEARHGSIGDYLLRAGVPASDLALIVGEFAGSRAPG
jgi:protein-tyrosine phosphatase